MHAVLRVRRRTTFVPHLHLQQLAYEPGWTASIPLTPAALEQLVCSRRARISDRRRVPPLRPLPEPPTATALPGSAVAGSPLSTLIPPSTGAAAAAPGQARRCSQTALIMHEPGAAPPLTEPRHESREPEGGTIRAAGEEAGGGAVVVSGGATPVDPQTDVRWRRAAVHRVTQAGNGTR